MTDPAKDAAAVQRNAEQVAMAVQRLARGETVVKS